MQTRQKTQNLDPMLQIKRQRISKSDRIVTILQIKTIERSPKKIIEKNPTVPCIHYDHLNKYT